MDEEGRQRVWQLYGWFAGLMLCGSCLGILSWTSWMQCLVNLFQGNDPSTPPPRASLLNSVAYSWRAAHTVFYPVEFLCLSLSKLMILDRMIDFVEMHAGQPRKWIHWRRVVIFVVSAGNLLGLAADFTAAAHYGKSADFFGASFTEHSANNTATGLELFKEGRAEQQNASSIASHQYVSEAAVLLFIIAAFTWCSALCARRIRATLSVVDDGRHTTAAQTAARQLLKQIMRTNAVVFAAFMVRSCYSLMQAVAYMLQNTGTSCSPNFCDPCYNVFTHITFWMTRTPIFQLTIVLLSFPVTLLIALWSMTPKIILRKHAGGSHETQLLPR
jgi:hypothetical protein